MTAYTEQELIAAVQAGYHAPDDLPLATRSWLEGYRAGRSNPQPALDQRYMNPRLWTKEMSDAWHSNIPDLQKAFDALLSAGKETV